MIVIFPVRNGQSCYRNATFSRSSAIVVSGDRIVSIAATYKYTLTPSGTFQNNGQFYVTFGFKFP